MAVRAARQGGNQFSRDAKLDEGALIRLAFAFCTGDRVADAAHRGGVSPKTARAVYIRLRARLAQPAFNRWHAGYQKLVTATSADAAFLRREAFLDALAGCYFDATCFRNHTLGNRKTRLCRRCPLPNSFTRPDSVDAALAVVDAVHAFYARIGIRGESALLPSSLFHLRLLHTTTISTALAASRRPDRRLIRPEKDEPMSVWSLLDLILTDLTDRPL